MSDAEQSAETTSREKCNERGCDRVPAYAGYCSFHLEQYDQIVVTSAKNRDEKDVFQQECVDVAHGMATTAFVFERDDGSLTGIKVPTDAIQWVDFTIPEPPKDQEVSA